MDNITLQPKACGIAWFELARSEGESQSFGDADA